MSAPSYARVIDVCDAAVAVIAAKWAPSVSDQVSRQYELPITENDLLVTGRQVWVFPGSYSRVKPASRGLYENEYKVRVVTAERYTVAPGLVPNSWVDVRLNFVAEYVVDALDFAIDQETAAGFLLGSLWTDSIEVVESYAPDLLAGDKLFFSEIVIGFHEHSLP